MAIGGILGAKKTEKTFFEGEPIEFKTVFGTKQGTIAEVVPAGVVPKTGDAKARARRVDSCIIAVRSIYHDAADRPRSRIDHHQVDVSALRERVRVPVEAPSMDRLPAPAF